MASTNLDILIKARDQASATIKKVQTAGAGLGTSLTKSTTTASKSMTSMGSVARKVGGYIGVAFGAHVLFQFGKEALIAFGEAEASMRRFAFAAQGTGIDVGRFNQRIEEMQWDLAIDDEALRDMATELLNMGGAANLSAKQLADETLAVQNISAATGKATPLIQRMFVMLNTNNPTGAIMSFKRLGLLTGEQIARYKELIAAGHLTAVSQVLLAKAIDADAGAAEAAITPVQALGHSWGEMKEAAGGYIAGFLGITENQKQAVIGTAQAKTEVDGFMESVKAGTMTVDSFNASLLGMGYAEAAVLAGHPEVFQEALNDAFEAGNITVGEYTAGMESLGKTEQQIGAEISRVNGIIAEQGGNLRKSAKDLTHFTFVGVKDWRVWRDATIEATREAMNALGGIEVQTKATAKDFQKSFGQMIRAGKQYERALSKLAHINPVPPAFKQWLIDEGPEALMGFVAQSKKTQDQDITKWKQHQGVIEDTERIIKSLGATAKSSMATATNIAAQLRLHLAAVEGTYEANVVVNVVGGGVPHGVRVIPFAAGGIVTRPTLALIGEAGPEAVIPLRGGRAPAGAAADRGAPVVLLDRKRFVEVADHEVRYSGHA